MRRMSSIVKYPNQRNEIFVRITILLKHTYCDSDYEMWGRTKEK